MSKTVRYEIKYRVSPQKALQIRDWVRRFMEPDAHSLGSRYAVHSLYLDGADWSIYRDTLNGDFSRFKLRARTYEFTPDAQWFLEVKSRDGEAMSKTRATVGREEARRLAWGEAPSRRESGEALENFRLQRDLRGAFPREWVTYLREAYVGGERDLVRVTFDTDIFCAPPTEDLSEPQCWFPVEESQGQVVLEVKYTGSYPSWIADMIRRFDLERGSMSKYRHAVESLHGLGQVAFGGRSMEWAR